MNKLLYIGFCLAFVTQQLGASVSTAEEKVRSFMLECLNNHRGYKSSGKSAAFALLEVQKAFEELEPAKRKELLGCVAPFRNDGWTALHIFAQENKYVEFFFLFSLAEYPSL
jgi:hypothetical protein